MSRKDKGDILLVENIMRSGKSLTVSMIQDELERRFDCSRNRRTIYGDIAAIERLYPIERFKHDQKTYYRMMGGGKI